MRTIEEMFRVDGKNALVTGGAGGIGLACAKALAAAGANLILSDIDSGRLDEAAEEIRRENGPSGGRCVTAVCDVADLQSVEKLLEQTRDNGGVDILIHSAAVTNRKQLLDCLLYTSKKENVDRGVGRFYPSDMSMKKLSLLYMYYHTGKM